eukprot:5964159-Pleurochrysis_carterae.AAC.7
MATRGVPSDPDAEQAMYSAFTTAQHPHHTNAPAHAAFVTPYIKCLRNGRPNLSRSEHVSAHPRREGDASPSW